MLPGERVILESDAKTLVLTSHRVRYHATGWGSSKVISIMLEEVSSCGLVRVSHPGLLLLAAVCGLTLVAVEDELRPILLVMGLALVVAFLFTRRNILAIASSGHTIATPTSGMSTANVMMFIEQTEAAKNALH